MKYLWIYLMVALSLSKSKTATGQVFTKLNVEDNIIATNDGSLRLNALESDGKIYYTTRTGTAAQAASLLCVIDKDGKNNKLFAQTYMIGANFITATDQFIYYNSYVDKYSSYDFYRFNKTSEKVEKIIYSETGDPVSYGIDAGVAFSKTYTFKDKLALVGFAYGGKEGNILRHLAIVEDASPTPIFVSANVGKGGGFETSFIPSNDEIAITESSIIYYNTNDSTKAIDLNFNKRLNNNYPDKYFLYPRPTDFKKNGYKPIGIKLTYANGKIYTLLQKIDDSINDSAYLYMGDILGVGGTLLDLKNTLSYYGIFMKAFGNNIYFGDKFKLYKYDVNTNSTRQLINLVPDENGLLSGIGLIQNQDYLLQSTDGTIFIGINTFYDFGPKVVRQNGVQTILAINPNNTVDTVCKIEGVNCSRENYKIDNNPSFVVNNSFYRIGRGENYKEWLIKYNKENNWQPTRIDYPQIKKYETIGNTGYAPSIFQLPNALLINNIYSSKKRNIQSMYLFTEK